MSRRHQLNQATGSRRTIQCAQFLFQYLLLGTEIAGPRAVVLALIAAGLDKLFRPIGLIIDQPFPSNPIMQQLQLVVAEYAEHGCAIALHQLPETALRRVFVALNPASLFQGREEISDLSLLIQPFIDGAALYSTEVRVHVARDQGLLFKHSV